MTTASAPAPLTPPDCDLRDFACMFLDIVRLFSSDFHASATDAEWRAGVTLWGKAWHQVPAASLPADDAALARLAEYGRDIAGWQAVKAKALHGWTLANDGRLYHRVVAEKALEAWIAKLGQRKSSEAGNAKRWRKVYDPTAENAAIATAARMLRALNPQSSTFRKRITNNDPALADPPDDIPGEYPNGSPNGNPTGIAAGVPRDRDISKKEKDAASAAREGSGQEGATTDSKPQDAKAWLFGEGKTWISEAAHIPLDRCGGIIGRWRKSAKDNDAIIRDAVEAAMQERPAEPVGWITKAIEARLQTLSVPFVAAFPSEWRDRLTAWRVQVNAGADPVAAWPAKWGGTGPLTHPGHLLPDVARVFSEFGFTAPTGQTSGSGKTEQRAAA